MTNSDSVGYPLAASFGRKVAQLRDAKGLSQTDLAERLKDLGYPMHQTTVAKMEGAKRPTSIEEVAAVAAALDASVETLLEGEDAAGAAALARANSLFGAASRVRDHYYAIGKATEDMLDEQEYLAQFAAPPGSDGYVPPILAGTIRLRPEDAVA